MREWLTLNKVIHCTIAVLFGNIAAVCLLILGLGDLRAGCGAGLAAMIYFYEAMGITYTWK